MKFTKGQIVALVLALGFAALLIFDAPYEAAAAVADASKQVVYASLFEPPVIGGAPGKVDFPLLMLELVFVTFIGGAIFLVAGANRKSE